MKCSGLRLTVIIEEEDGQYAAYCKELGTASCGDTHEEAERNIKDAILVDLNGLDEAGIRDEFFAKRGIELEEFDIEMPRESRGIKFETERSEEMLRLAYC